ncbi:hypothetical protein AXW84_09645 [Hymenobacter sp. PAMC 26628]|nr:hypothetical protein AXW84_09645 [Hymenobacter sp. PAMC 26628]
MKFSRLAAKVEGLNKILVITVFGYPLFVGIQCFVTGKEAWKMRGRKILPSLDEGGHIEAYDGPVEKRLSKMKLAHLPDHDELSRVN